MTATPATSLLRAIAILSIAAPACLDRALPGAGMLGGSTAGASGVITAGAGGAGGAATTGTGAGGAGGSAAGCPALTCPGLACGGPRAVDDRGCEICACADGPDPGGCQEIACGSRPPPPAACPDTEIACVPRGDQCVWSIAPCKQPTPCPAPECGPIPDLPPQACYDGPAPPPDCTRDPDATCRWHYAECAPACAGLATPESCDKVAGCQWLIRACGGPTIPATACVDKRDLGCNNTWCAAPRRCERVMVDSCTLPQAPPGTGCADAVCRDVGIAVCAWW